MLGRRCRTSTKIVHTNTGYSECRCEEITLIVTITRNNRHVYHQSSKPTERSCSRYLNPGFEMPSVNTRSLFGVSSVPTELLIVCYPVSSSLATGKMERGLRGKTRRKSKSCGNGGIKMNEHMNTIPVLIYGWIDGGMNEPGRINELIQTTFTFCRVPPLYSFAQITTAK